MAISKIEQGYILARIIEMGPVFCGDNAEASIKIAQEWVDHCFSKEEVQAWMDVGFWNPTKCANIQHTDITLSTVKKMNDINNRDYVYEFCEGKITLQEFHKVAMQIQEPYYENHMNEACDEAGVE